MADVAVLGDLPVAPGRPLGVSQQGLDRLALVLVGATQPVVGIGPDRVQDGVAPRAVADEDRDVLDARGAEGVVAVMAR